MLDWGSFPEGRNLLKYIRKKMNGTDSDSIAIIDFEAYSLEKDSPDKEKLPHLVDEIHHALTTVGFFYLKNTGLATEVIKDALEKSKTFFTSELEEKMKYTVGKVVPGSLFGYTTVNQERLNPDRDIYDLKECYNYLPDQLEKVDPEVLKGSQKGYDMIKALHTYFEHGRTLHHRLLEIIAIGLQLEDPYFFVKKHKLCGKKGGVMNLRTLFYPGVNKSDVIDGQFRCGEHSDYGGVIFLIQDRPGLEVRNRKGHWTPAPPIDGTVVVNIGDLMQRWTSDKLVAGKHRVILPESEEELRKSRQSIIFFGQPDHDEIIECIDGSEKYPPVGSGEYFAQKLLSIFKKEKP